MRTKESEWLYTKHWSKEQSSTEQSSKEQSSKEQSSKERSSTNLSSKEQSSTELSITEQSSQEQSSTEQSSTNQSGKEAKNRVAQSRAQQGTVTCWSMDRQRECLRNRIKKMTRKQVNGLRQLIFVPAIKGFLKVYQAILPLKRLFGCCNSGKLDKHRNCWRSLWMDLRRPVSLMWILESLNCLEYRSIAKTVSQEPEMEWDNLENNKEQNFIHRENKPFDMPMQGIS